MRPPLALAALVWLAAACASIDAKTTQYVGAPRFAPSDAKTVQILRAEPTQPHDKLGEVMLEVPTEPGPPVEEIEQRLREEAATLGASAVVVVFDRMQPVGAFVSGGWYTRTVDVVEERKIVGVAIRTR
ncbi:MAG TPA: hypothetical protein VEQ87_22070 [Burkholderiales bacterium]|nr:hypothetical protein [Burkholderiales bacterium]